MTDSEMTLNLISEKQHRDATRTLLDAPDMLAQAASCDRIRALMVRNIDPNVGFFAMSIQQCHQRWLNSFNNTERRELWLCLNQLARDLVTITKQLPPDIPKQIYDELEKA